MNTKELIKLVEPKFSEVIKSTNSELNWIKESGFALQSLEGNELLKNCSSASIMTAIYNVALTGLTLNPKLAYCYLVPRGGKAILDISYQGLNYIMTNQLDVKSIHSDVIYQEDVFDYFTDQNGVNIYHRPDKFNDGGDAIGVYAIAYLRSGDCVATVLNNKEIEAIKNTSKSANSKFSPWNNFENEMKKKTAIRRLWKMIPKTERIEEAIETINVEDDNFDANWNKTKKEKEKKNYTNMFSKSENVEIVEEAIEGDLNEDNEKVDTSTKEQVENLLDSSKMPLDDVLTNARPNNKLKNRKNLI